MDRVYKAGIPQLRKELERLQKEFFAIVNGTKPDRHGWLSPVGVPSGAAVR